ncbi:MAG: hypothetical protein HYY49_05245 [Ignavibacteriales bacterium]|nr:hypothetical protein [Ignavibacteriales bacterium]
MKQLIARFLESSHVDPVYLIIGIVDLMSVFLWRRLRGGIPEWQRALFKAVIIVAIVLTAAALCKHFGLINDWKDLRPNWSF